MKNFENEPFTHNQHQNPDHSLWSDQVWMILVINQSLGEIQ